MKKSGLCKKCGEQLYAGENFCENCGSPVIKAQPRPHSCSSQLAEAVSDQAPYLAEPKDTKSYGFVVAVRVVLAIILAILVSGAWILVHDSQKFSILSKPELVEAPPSLPSSNQQIRESMPIASPSIIPESIPESEPVTPVHSEAAPATAAPSQTQGIDSTLTPSPDTLPTDAVALAWHEYQAAEAVYQPAFTHYTELVTTGGSGDVQVALAEYKRAFEAKKAAYQRWLDAKDAASSSDENSKQRP